MSWSLALPLVVPFATAILAFLARGSNSGRWISLAGSLIGLWAALALFVAVLGDGVVVGQMGGWPAPFGITLVADLLSAIMVLLTAITAVIVATYALADIGEGDGSMGYHTLFQILIGGVTGAFLTGDLFNLYVWFEVMLIASFGLLVMGGRPEQIDGAVKYVTLNLISTVLFLTGIGLLYGTTGTLNMADLARAVAERPDDGIFTVIAMLFMIAFGVKAAVFPLFFWLPASYHTPAYSVTAVFAGLLTKVGLYALVRMFTLVFVLDTGFTHTIFLWIAAITMVVGVLGAAAQSDFRKILAFHSVSQIGYMLLGLALMTPLGLAGTVFFLVHHNIVKANLFLVAGVSERLTGSGNLYAIGGLYKASPVLAAFFLVSAFSLAGFPPLAGFWAKYLLVKASLELELWVVAGVALGTGLLTIFSMTKIWGEAFWRPHPGGDVPSLASLGGARLPLLLPIGIFTIMTLWLGLAPQAFLTVAERAAVQLLAPGPYIAAVLGGGS